MANKNFTEFAENIWPTGQAYVVGYLDNVEIRIPVTGFAAFAPSGAIGLSGASIVGPTGATGPSGASITIVGNGLALTGQNLNLNFGLGSGQVSSGNHNHFLRTQLTYAATMTPDCTDGFNRFIVMGGTGTINPPTNGTDGTILKLRVFASGASRNLHFNSAIKTPTGSTYTATIASGSTRMTELEHNGTSWLLIKNLEFTA